MMNLDDATERSEFISRYGTLKGRALANRLGLRGKGSAKTATALSGFAWNAQTAANCRLAGDIPTAKVYEEIADRIYRESLVSLGWW